MHPDRAERPPHRPDTPLVYSEQIAVMAARRGDEAALTWLLRHHDRMIRAIASDFYAAGHDRKDVQQEGRLGYLTAVRDWQPGRASFRHFARHCVRREIQAMVQRANRNKHAVLTHADRLERPVRVAQRPDAATVGDTLTAPPRDAGDPEHTALMREQLATMVAATDSLTALERDALTLILNDYSYADAATTLATGVRAVNNAVQRARAKLGAAGRA